MVPVASLRLFRRVLDVRAESQADKVPTSPEKDVCVCVCHRAAVTETRSGLLTVDVILGEGGSLELSQSFPAILRMYVILPRVHVAL